MPTVALPLLKRGDLLVWKNFRFADGTRKTKRVLLLSNCIHGKIYVAALPTSNTAVYIEGRRSFEDTVCFPVGSIACFEVDTVIDLKNLAEVSVADLVRGLGKGIRFHTTSLPNEALAQIMTAIESARTLTREEKDRILDGWGK